MTLKQATPITTSLPARPSRIFPMTGYAHCVAPAKTFSSRPDASSPAKTEKPALLPRCRFYYVDLHLVVNHFDPPDQPAGAAFLNGTIIRSEAFGMSVDLDRFTAATIRTFHFFSFLEECRCQGAGINWSITTTNSLRSARSRSPMWAIRKVSPFSLP